MKKYVADEIEEIDKKIEDLTKKLSDGFFSTYGAELAKESAKILMEIRDFLKSEDSDSSKVGAVITRIPLLYLKISQIN